MLSKVEIQQLMFINTLGLYTLVETLRTAQYVFHATNNRGHAISPKSGMRQRAEECFAFIQGTGLEMMLRRHHIDLDAEVLRDGFYTAIGRREFIE